MGQSGGGLPIRITPRQISSGLPEVVNGDLRQVGLLEV